jgi:hypothetical protein
MIEKYLVRDRPKYLIKKKNVEEYLQNSDPEADLSDGNDPNNEDEYNQNNFIMKQSRDNSKEKDNERDGDEEKVVKNYIIETKDQPRVNFMPCKIKALDSIDVQEKIEEKVRQEYEALMKEKEKDIENKVKKDFEEAINKLKGELQSSLLEEKKRLEIELAKKWEDQYDNLVIECKSKLREDKEKQLAQNMYYKLKPTVEKEIYKKELVNVEQKIRGEVEHQIKNDVIQKKTEEIEKAKRKLEHYTRMTCEEMEKDIKTKFKDNFDQELSKEVEKREKELKVT